MNSGSHLLPSRGLNSAAATLAIRTLGSFRMKTYASSTQVTAALCHQRAKHPMLSTVQMKSISFDNVSASSSTETESRPIFSSLRPTIVSCDRLLCFVC